jgi:hypothetical protein
MSTEEFPSLRFVLTSTVSKLGLSIAPIPDEINELVALVILLMSDDLICSESSALTPKENPIDMVKIELSNIFDKLELDILIILIIKFKKLILNE